MTKELMLYSWGETLGDGLLKLPAIAAAREAFPGWRIVWCVAQGTVYGGALAPLVRGTIDEILDHPKNGGLRPLDAVSLRPFGGRRFDVVVDTQLLVLPAITAKRAAKERFVSAAAGFALSDARPARGWPGALADQLAALIGLAAGRETPPRALKLEDAELLAAARHLLPDGPRYVGLAPGAGGKDKIWPLGNYLAIAGALAARGIRPVFFIGPQEEAWLAEIRAQAPEALIPEWGRTDPYTHLKGPLLAVALAGRLAAAVANDSGVGHALAAGGAPLLSLQRSARKAVKFRPAAERLELLVAEDFGEEMSAIPRHAVEERLERLLEIPR